MISHYSSSTVVLYCVVAFKTFKYLVECESGKQNRYRFI
jgi:hypothetical protein